MAVWAVAALMVWPVLTGSILVMPGATVLPEVMAVTAVTAETGVLFRASAVTPVVAVQPVSVVPAGPGSTVWPGRLRVRMAPMVAPVVPAAPVGSGAPRER
jgi:hypothetical protein